MIRQFVFLASFLAVSISFSQSVSTIYDGNFYDGLTLDSKGNLYCSDFTGDSVYKYDTNGVVSVFSSGFIQPNGIAATSQDEVLVCEAGANRISKFDLDGNLLATYTTDVDNPTGIQQIPGSDDLLFVEYNNNSLKKLTANGTVISLYSGFPLNGPSGIAFINGETFVSNYEDRKIMRFSEGEMSLVAQLPATAEANNKLGFLSASDTELFATQIGAHQIYTVDPVSGKGAVFAGSSMGDTDGDLTDATFNFPNGIVVDKSNNKIYISDAGTSNLRIIDKVLLSSTIFHDSAKHLMVSLDRFADTLNIQASLFSKEKASIKIFQITGREVLSKEFPVVDLEFSGAIDCSSLQAGVYIVLFTQNNIFVSKKIVF